MVTIDTAGGLDVTVGTQVRGFPDDVKTFFDIGYSLSFRWRDASEEPHILFPESRSQSTRNGAEGLL